MKKNQSSSSFRCLFMQRKLMSILKLTSVFVMCLVINVNAKVLSQNTIVSLNFKKEKLKTIFTEIKRQTSYDFCYSEKFLDVNKKVDAKFQNEKLSKVLNSILGEAYTFRYESNFVVITPKVKEDKKDKVIKGEVVDSKNKPLPGVTIVVKGTSLGVATDVKGQFSIKAKVGDVLHLSFIGMESKDVKIKDFKKLKITLKEDRKSLNEVVCTGYEVKEKRKMSSSIQTIKGEELRQAGVISVDKLLQGKITGLNVIGQSSTPGAAPKIRLRGSSSLTGNREPIWVVDGVVLEEPVQIPTEELNSLDKINLIGNAISFLNPEDIARVDVLKDASATAIYGVKAANGVIVITTKRGERGPTRVSYSTNMSVKMAPTYRKLHRMNSKERIELSEEIQEKALAEFSQFPGRVAYEGALMDLWDKNITTDEFLLRVKELKETNTDWYDLLFRNAVSQTHNLSFSGGSDKTNYYFSLGYGQDNGATLGVGMKRLSANFKLDFKLKENLKVGINMNIGSTKNKRPHSSIDMNKYAYQTSRAIKAYNADGTYSYYNAGKGYKENLAYNIFNELDNSGSEVNNQSYSFQFNMDWKIAKGIKYRGLISYSKSNSDQKEWAGQKSFYVSDIRRANYDEEIRNYEDYFKEKVCQLPYGGEMNSSRSTNCSYVIRNSLSFIKSFDQHLFSTHLGTEIHSSEYDGLKSIQRGYFHDRGMNVAEINPAKWLMYAKWVNSHPDVFSLNTKNTLSMYGTFNYSYKNKYSLNFNIRADGSNKFGQDSDNKFLPVWSASGRWNIQEEAIFKNITWLNMLSIRASYGIQGNVHPDQVPNLIVHIGKLNDTMEEFTSKLHKLPNKKLKWEKTKSYDLGVDFALFDNKIFGTVDVYKKKGTDQIVTRSVSYTTGTEEVSINSGSVENKGWELSLNLNPIQTKNTSLSFSFNTSKNYNKVSDAGIVETKYDDYLNGNIIINGKAINSFYSYKFDGLDPEKGLPMFKDIDEPDDITKQEMFDKVFTYSGKRIADLTGGFSMNFRYKRWSINGLFSFSLGNKVRLNPMYKDDSQKLPSPQQNMDDIFVERWRKPGDEKFTNIPVLSEKSLALSTRKRKYTIADNLWQMYNKSDLRVVSGDFLRMKNVSLRYSLSNDFCKKMKLSSISMHVSLDNVFYIADSKLRGRDPEQVEMGSGTLPPLRTINAGLSVTF